MGETKRAPWNYKPIPIPDDHGDRDITFAQFMWFFICGARRARGMIKRGVANGTLEVYRLDGSNEMRISYPGARRLRASLIDKGLKIKEPRPQTSKRKPGGQRIHPVQGKAS
jgi:hypothetical protein